jgi:hypothetical protein
MKEIKKTMWIIVNIANGNPQLKTLAPYRKETIKLFLDGTQLEWKTVKSWGWRAIKVKVTIEQP